MRSGPPNSGYVCRLMAIMVLNVADSRPRCRPMRWRQAMQPHGGPHMPTTQSTTEFEGPIAEGGVEPMPLSVVLVHGAWANGSCWNKVVPLLKARGVDVVAVHNPLTAFEADVTGTRRVVDDQPGDVVLVGHSYGGVVITEVGAQPKVKALVYVAAFAPSEGESINSGACAVRRAAVPRRTPCRRRGNAVLVGQRPRAVLRARSDRGGEDAAGGHPGALCRCELRRQGHLGRICRETVLVRCCRQRSGRRRRFRSTAPRRRGRQRSTSTPATSRCLPNQMWWPISSSPRSRLRSNHYDLRGRTAAEVTAGIQHHFAPSVVGTERLQAHPAASASCARQTSSGSEAVYICAVNGAEAC